PQEKEQRDGNQEQQRDPLVVLCQEPGAHAITRVQVMLAIEGNAFATHMGMHWELEILKLDESCISNPKFPKCKLDRSNLKFRISDLRCRIRPISKFPQPLSGVSDRMYAIK